MTLAGQLAPSFSLVNAEGETIHLQDFLGKKVVLYFYPKDATPGCTTEACDFRDRFEDFSALNTVILGVSPDDEKSHAKFIAKHGLPFELLVDQHHAVAEQYGVWVLKKMYGREYMGIERSTFLIDEQGVVVQQWRKVKVKNHIVEVLSAIKEMEE